MTANAKEQYEHYNEHYKESIQEIGFTLAQVQAKLLLSFPVPLTYEDWCFLHSVVDGDIDSLKKLLVM